MKTRIPTEKKEEYSLKDETLDSIFEKKIHEAREKRDWIHFLWQTAICILVVHLLLNCFFGITVIHGESMMPTAQDGDVAIIWRFAKYQRGDIVLIKSEEEEEYDGLVKRIIALPGDTIDISDSGAVILNDVILDEDYTYVKTYRSDSTVAFPRTMGRQCYFVMGDNRTYSRDSRSSTIGDIFETELIGKVIFVFRLPK